MDIDKNDEWVSPSEEECEATQRAALEAAWEVLAPLRGFNSDREPRSDVVTVLSAFAAIEEVKKKANKDFMARNPGKLCHSAHVDEHHIVATAMAVGDDLYEDTHPYSVVGARVLSFAFACKALEACAAVEEALDASCMFSAPEANKILKSMSHEPEAASRME